MNLGWKKVHLFVVFKKNWSAPWIVMIIKSQLVTFWKKNRLSYDILISIECKLANSFQNDKYKLTIPLSFLACPLKKVLVNSDLAARKKLKSKMNWTFLSLTLCCLYYSVKNLLNCFNYFNLGISEIYINWFPNLPWKFKLKNIYVNIW